MIRISLSFIGSLILFLLQSFIVMKIFHYQSIHFENALQVVTVCIINFFLVFSMVTQMTPWFAKKNWVETETEE